jgi:nitrogen fixation protein NifZ
MLLPRFDYGEAVRVIRNIRNDGTFPGAARGDLLVRRGSVGHVRERGTFLQDQIVYSVHFLFDECTRVVGCRETELIAATDPWVSSRFESRDRVATGMHLSVNGTVVVPVGTLGEVLKVLRDAADGVHYHVIFPDGQVLQVPEGVLTDWEPATEKLAATG